MHVIFFMPIPTSRSKKKQLELLNKPHLFKPDLSNLIKFVEDCCNNIVFKDDCIITSINAQKVYSDTPRTEFYFSPYLSSTLSGAHPDEKNKD